jgi:hypothetical protein
VAGGDLDIAQIHVGIEHAGDERVAEDVRMRAAGLLEVPPRALLRVVDAGVQR